MSSTNRFDVAVIGLGLIGSAALRYLATSGLRCVGIGPEEPLQFATHTGGFASHYDSGRITRMLDTNLSWARLAQRSIAAYGDIEEMSGLRFHRPTGLVYSTRSSDEVAALRNTMRQLDIACTVDRAQGSFPDLRLGLGPWEAFVEPAPAGHLDPRVMRLAQLTIGQKQGAEIIRQTARSTQAIDAIVGGRSGWRIQLDDGDKCEAERVLVAAGPHTDEFIAPWGHLAFDVRNETIVTAVLDLDEQARLAGLPAVIADVDDESTDNVYLVPPTTYPDGTVRIKLGAELVTRRNLPTAVDRRSWMRSDEHLQQMPHLRRLLESLVPGIQSTNWATKPCLIPETPSTLPYVDHLEDGLVVAAGCNGFAGKSADAIGALAAELLREGKWTDTELHQSDFIVQWSI
jgi:sarcosine oxidase